MVGRHLIKAWSATQASISLSSGEAEYYGVVRGVGIGLGMQALYRDIGLEMPLTAWTDSSAAIGVAGRQGLGKLRHLECHSLWIQQRLRRKEFRLLKVAGEANPADLFTKHLESRGKVDQVVSLFNCKFLDGRPETAPALRRTPVHADAHINIAHDTSVLPHLHTPEDIAELFPEAEVDDARRGEGDEDPVRELRDPVPAITAARSKGSHPTKSNTPNPDVELAGQSQRQEAPRSTRAGGVARNGSHAPADPVNASRANAVSGNRRPRGSRPSARHDSGRKDRGLLICEVEETASHDQEQGRALAVHQQGSEGDREVRQSLDVLTLKIYTCESSRRSSTRSIQLDPAFGVEGAATDGVLASPKEEEPEPFTHHHMRTVRSVGIGRPGGVFVCVANRAQVNNNFEIAIDQYHQV